MYRFFTVVILLFCGTALFAQASNFFDRLQPELYAGVLLGSPYGKIPDNVVEFSGAPSIHPTFQGIISYPINNRFSLSTGLGYGRKGNAFSTVAEDKYNAADAIFGERFPIPLDVDYTAYVRGGFDNTYLDVPIYGAFRLGPWQLLAGYQYSYLHRRSYEGTIRVDVKVPFMEDQRMNFDDAYLLKNNDHAFLAGLSVDISKHWRISTRSTYSIVPIFAELPEGMTDNMKNIYINFLVGYVF